MKNEYVSIRYDLIFDFDILSRPFDALKTHNADK